MSHEHAPTDDAVRMAIYESLAALLAYPGPGFRASVHDSHACLCEHHAEAAALLSPFVDHVIATGDDELEELYTRTFDINPDCSLEIGWHLYGENYARGRLLVELRDNLRRLGIPESPELPDHLLHVLPILGSEDADVARTIAAEFVLPALGKMRQNLPTPNPTRPHAHVLEVIDRVIRDVHGVEAQAPEAEPHENAATTTCGASVVAPPYDISCATQNRGRPPCQP